MSFDNSILCKVCSGRNFEKTNGAFYCQSCGSESRAHGQDFVYDKTCPQLAESSEFCEDSDSNDENNWKNDYPDEDLLESGDNEESTNKDELLNLKNLESDREHQKFDSDTDEKEVQAGS